MAGTAAVHSHPLHRKVPAMRSSLGRLGAVVGIVALVVGGLVAAAPAGAAKPSAYSTYKITSGYGYGYWTQSTPCKTLYATGFSGGPTTETPHVYFSVNVGATTVAGCNYVSGSTSTATVTQSLSGRTRTFALTGTVTVFTYATDASTVEPVTVSFTATTRGQHFTTVHIHGFTRFIATGTEYSCTISVTVDGAAYSTAGSTTAGSTTAYGGCQLFNATLRGTLYN